MAFSKIEVASEPPSQVAAVALPVLSEASISASASASASASESAPNVDRLLARSRQLRQENNSSLLRDGLLEAGGRPDWSIGSSSGAAEEPALAQVKISLLSINWIQ